MSPAPRGLSQTFGLRMNPTQLREVGLAWFIQIYVRRSLQQKASCSCALCYLISMKRIEQAIDGVTLWYDVTARRSHSDGTSAVLGECLLNAVGSRMCDWRPAVHLAQKPHQAKARANSHFQSDRRQLLFTSTDSNLNRNFQDQNETGPFYFTFWTKLNLKTKAVDFKTRWIANSYQQAEASSVFAVRIDCWKKGESKSEWMDICE